MMIYKITNNVNNKCIVGKTTQKLMRRWIQHRCMLRINRHNNKHLQDAWNKYGEYSFSIEVLESFEDKDESFLNEREKFYISLHKSNDRNFGYNMTLGGDGQSGWVPSEEWREKRRNFMTGKRYTFTDEHKKNISIAKTGQKVSQNQIDNLKKRYIENKVKIDATLAKGRSNVTKEQRLMALDIAREKINKLWKTDEFKEKRRIALNTAVGIKIVDQYGKIYDNMTEASRAIGSQPGNIRKQIKGLIKHNKGFVFKEVISEGGE